MRVTVDGVTLILKPGAKLPASMVDEILKLKSYDETDSLMRKRPFGNRR